MRVLITGGAGVLSASATAFPGGRSRRTSHIFAKLDISSRAQLAAEVTRQAAGVATPGDRQKVIPR
jgi:hypothetical protein